MKIYTVIDWNPQLIYYFNSDNEALAKFRNLAISAEDHEYITMECCDTDVKACSDLSSEILILCRNGKIRAFDNALSGIASDMEDERWAAMSEPQEE